MTSSRRATAIVWFLITVLSVANLILTIMARNDLATTDAVTGLIDAPAPLLYATLGALIVRRAGNVIGWMLIEHRMVRQVHLHRRSAVTGPRVGARNRTVHVRRPGARQRLRRATVGARPPQRPRHRERRPAAHR